MAGQTTITQYMDAIAAIATAYGGGGIVSPKPGYTRWADGQNYEQLVAALNPVTPTAPPASPVQGFFSYWLKDFEYVENELNPARIIGEMAVYVPKDTSTDMNAAWDFMIGFVQAIGAGTNYLTGAGFAAVNLAPPGPIRCSLFKVQMIETGGLCMFDFGNYGSGGITIPDP